MKRTLLVLMLLLGFGTTASAFDRHTHLRGAITLTVTEPDAGTGAVTSVTPAGIACGDGGASCSLRAPIGTAITLLATPDANNTFTGWSGACTGAISSCTFTLTTSSIVTATFALTPGNPTLAIAYTGAGTGTVTCDGGQCLSSYPWGTTIMMTATPTADNLFGGWQGTCPGVTTNSCASPLTDNTSVTATFLAPPPPATLTVTTAGAGTVTSNLGGLNCGATCSTQVPSSTALILTATAAPGFTFTGWSGTGLTCPGTTPTCPLRLTANTSVTASVSKANGHVHPLKLGPTGRYLVDQTGKPFLLVGDAVWSLIVALSDTDADLYLANRQQLGFNTIMVGLLAPPTELHAYGLLPFTGQNFTSPNEAYFAHADTILQSAANKGIVVLLSVLYLGYQCGAEGWCNEIQTATTSDMRTWGQYLGNRYKNYDNIIWVIGGDTDPSPLKSKVQAMVDGILSIDTRHLFTAHNARGVMARTPWVGAAWLNVNNTYTDGIDYQQALTAYAISPSMPFFLIESNYENEGPSAPALRAQSYWTVLSGGFGHVFGNCPLWGFGFFTSGFCSSANWKAQLNSAGSMSMQRFQALFNSRHWQTLVPDTSHTVLTAGYGSSGQYVTAAYASDGSSVIAYLPSSRTVTMSGTRLAGASMIAWWFNPTTGAATQIGTFATTGTQLFTPPASGDWVLVLDSATAALPPPGSN